MIFHDWLIRYGGWPGAKAVDLIYWAAFHLRPFRLPGRSSVKTYRDYKTRSFSAGVINVCNAKCTFCAYPKTVLKRGTMSLLYFSAGLLKWRVGGGTAVDLTPTVGDPLIDPGLIEKIKFAKKIGMRVSLTTNAILLHRFDKALIEAGLDELYISLPSLDANVYRQVYGVDKASEVYVGLVLFLSMNKERGEPVKVGLRFRNAELPSAIIRSPGFRSAVAPYLSSRVRVNFTAGFDNWGGLIKPGDMRGTMKLKAPTRSNVPCEGLFGLAMLHDGKLRACACRFVENENDDLIVGHIDEGLEPARKRAMEIADGFLRGVRPKTCQGCTLYHPVR